MAMIAPEEYPEECPNCSRRLPGLVFSRARMQPKARRLCVISVPLMAAWAIGWFCFSPVHIIAVGNPIVMIAVGLLYLGPGLLLVLWAMAIPQVRHVKCPKCPQEWEVRAPSIWQRYQRGRQRAERREKWR